MLALRRSRSISRCARSSSCGLSTSMTAASSSTLRLPRRRYTAVCRWPSATDFPSSCSSMRRPAGRLNNNLLDYKLSTFMDHPNLRGAVCRKSRADLAVRHEGARRAARLLRRACHPQRHLAGHRRRHRHNADHPAYSVRGILEGRPDSRRLGEGGKVSHV